jgi:acyl carrier protein
MDDIRGKIEQFLLRMFRVKHLGAEEDIFSLGAINSLFAMQLILYLEKEFQIRIENKDMDLNYFRTLTSITELVERKRQLSLSGTKGEG